VYEGEWKAGIKHGHGTTRSANGDVYVGEYMAGERAGRGAFKHVNGQTLVSKWRQNAPVGEGVQWAADGSKAARLMDGKPVASITIEEGAAIAARLEMPVPDHWLKS
jgi:hypothetical protein